MESDHPELLGCCSRFQLTNQVGVLPHLREFELRISILALQLIVPVPVQHVDDSLRVGVGGIEDVSGLFLRFVRNRAEAALHAICHRVDGAEQRVCLVAVGELTLIAHLEDSLLRTAATILDCLNHSTIALIDGVDDALAGVTDFAGDAVDIASYVANRLIECVKRATGRLR